MATRLLLITLGTLLAVTACRTPRELRSTVPEAAPSADGGISSNSSSALGVGDFLDVRVYQEADLSGTYRVSSEGVIDFPLCGRVTVLGASPSMVAQTITECLKNGFVRRPQVTVMVKEFNSKKIFVFGDITKPGAFAYEEGMTIIQAISQAGGFTRSASRNDVNVTRVVDGREAKVQVRVEDIAMGREKNFVLVPGDIIFVPEGFL